MARIHAFGSARIEAPPSRVYAILADYGDGHRRILPERYFRDLQVEQGGRGAGTVIRFQMTALGATRTLRAEVSEPEPGRVLREVDLETGAVTTFLVEPLGGDRSSVRIETRWERGGLSGLVERLFAPLVLRKVYAEELRKLAALAAEEPVS